MLLLKINSNQLPDSYSMRIVRRHIVYIISFILFIIIGVFFIPTHIQEYVKLKNDVNILEKDVKQLEERNIAIRQYDGVDIEQLLLVLNTIFPNVEDRFSLFAAIDNLQVISHVNISGFTSPFSGSKGEDVVIVIEARVFDSQLRSIFEDYHFKSGRFMTIDKVSFNPITSSLVFSATFHSEDINIDEGSIVEYNPENIKQVTEMLNYLRSHNPSFKRTVLEPEEIPTNYKIKQDPFK